MTWLPPEEWRIHRRYDPIRNVDEVYIAHGRSLDGRPIPFLVEISTGPAVLREVDPRVSPPPDQPTALLFPEGVLEAIAEHVKPGPSQGEVKRLEDALTVERMRVDAILERAGTPTSAIQAVRDLAAAPIDPLAPGPSVSSFEHGDSVYVWRDSWETVNRTAAKQTGRAADLRTGLDLALRIAEEVYELETRVEAVEPGQISAALSRLVETLKGTIERDDRI